MLDLFNVLAKVSCPDGNICCGQMGDKGIPGNLAEIIHFVYLGIQVVIPILLILFGMIELGKAITAQKEDEIKKAQGSFFKKLILAVLVFLVFTIVQFVFDFAAGGDGDADGSVWKCICELTKGANKCG